MGSIRYEGNREWWDHYVLREEDPVEGEDAADIEQIYIKFWIRIVDGRVIVESYHRATREEL
jgi:hypothetical protein